MGVPLLRGSKHSLRSPAFDLPRLAAQVLEPPTCPQRHGRQQQARRATEAGPRRLTEAGSQGAFRV